MRERKEISGRVPSSYTGYHVWRTGLYEVDWSLRIQDRRWVLILWSHVVRSALSKSVFAQLASC